MHGENEGDASGASALDLAGALAGVGGVALLAGLAAGGPLSPPGGAIAPTSKTIQEVEPRTPISAATTPGDASAVYVIAQPGSYYLTGPVSVPGGKVGIRVASGDVTIDLRGFTISGNDAGLDGISDGGAAQSNVTIRDGVIERHTRFGIFMLSRPARISDLTLRGNARMGALVSSRVRFERVLADGNGAGGGGTPGGIYTAGEAALVDCAATFNTGVGINAGAGAVVRGCVAVQNTGSGIAAGYGAVIGSCVCVSNAVGFECQQAASLSDCVAQGNLGNGFQTSWAAVIRRCTASGNGGRGYQVFEGCLLADSNASGNQVDGYSTGQGPLVARCVSATNAVGFNLSAGTGGLIADCVARANQTAGISVFARTLVRGNTSDGNSTIGVGSPGIFASGQSNRIEGNHAIFNNGNGIHVNNSRNMIVSNTCGINVSNWNLFSNCLFGPVVNRVGLSVSGMSGNGTVAGTLATADPYANLTF